MRNIVEFLPRGAAIRFEFRDSSSEDWEPRIAIVWGVRDLEQRPLSAKAVTERPDLDRSGLLLYAWDLARSDWRRFYLHRVRHVELTDLKPLLAIAGGMQRSAEKRRRAC